MPPKAAPRTPAKSIPANNGNKKSQSTIVAPIVLPLVSPTQNNDINTDNITEENIDSILEKLDQRIVSTIQKNRDQNKIAKCKELLDTLGETETLAVDFTTNQKKINRNVIYIQSSLNSLK